MFVAGLFYNIIYVTRFVIFDYYYYELKIDEKLQTLFIIANIDNILLDQLRQNRNFILFSNFFFLPFHKNSFKIYCYVHLNGLKYRKC